MIRWTFEKKKMSIYDTIVVGEGPGGGAARERRFER